MSGEHLTEEDEFQIINDNMKDLNGAFERGDEKEIFKRIVEMNKLLKAICDNYELRHDMNSGVFDVNLTNSLNLRNLLLLNALFVIGPYIYSDESAINWDNFSTTLDIPETILRANYKQIPYHFSEESISSIVKTSLTTGFIEDFEIAGVVYSIAYFIQFVLKVESSSLPFSDCVTFFYSKMTSYSYPLLITSIISIQQNNRRREEWLVQGVSRLMTTIVMQSNGLYGIINTYLSFSEGADMDAIIHVAKGLSTCHPSVKEEVYWDSIFLQITHLLLEKNTNKYILITCCHILRNAVILHPDLFYKSFFAKVFGCYIMLVKQPFYRSISIEEPFTFPIPAERLSQANFLLLRLCQYGGTLLALLNSITVLIPPLLQLYSFARAHSLGLTAVLAKVLHTYIQHSRYAVRTVVMVLQGEGIVPHDLQFSLDADCRVQIVEASPESEWSFRTVYSSTGYRDIDSLIQLFAESQSDDSCSELLIEILDILFSSHLHASDVDPMTKINGLTVLTRMLDLSFGKQFFQFNLLRGLQVIEKLFGSLSHSTEMLDMEGVGDLLGIVDELLRSICQQSISIPKVIDLEREKDIRARKKKAAELVAEDEIRYKQKLVQTVRLLIQENEDYTGLWSTAFQQSIRGHLCAIQKQIEELAVGINLLNPSQPSTILDEFHSLLKELHNPYSPIRSMGLSRLEGLIKHRTEDELKPLVPRFLIVLQKSINDEDPCVYLAGISAVMILGSRFHDEVIPFLLTIIGNPAAPFDLRIRGIEAVVNLIHYMNESSSKFADNVVNTLLFYMNRENEISWMSVEVKTQVKATAEDEVSMLQLLRASCFSALAEVCSTLLYGIDRYLPEILSQCKGVMLFERDDTSAVAVRQGVGFLVYRLIETFSTRKPTTLQNELMEVEIIIQQGLKDPDLTVCSHFRKCADLYQTYSRQTLRKPLIEIL